MFNSFISLGQLHLKGQIQQQLHWSEESPLEVERCWCDQGLLWCCPLEMSSWSQGPGQFEILRRHLQLEGNINPRVIKPLPQTHLYHLPSSSSAVESLSGSSPFSRSIDKTVKRHIWVHSLKQNPPMLLLWSLTNFGNSTSPMATIKCWLVDFT